MNNSQKKFIRDLHSNSRELHDSRREKAQFSLTQLYPNEAGLKKQVGISYPNGSIFYLSHFATHQVKNDKNSLSEQLPG